MCILLRAELSSWPDLPSTVRTLPPWDQWTREICSPAAKGHLSHHWNRPSLLPESRETSHGAFCSCSPRLPTLTVGQRWSWTHWVISCCPAPSTATHPLPQQQGAIPPETKLLANHLPTRNPFWGQRGKGSPSQAAGEAAVSGARGQQHSLTPGLHFHRGPATLRGLHQTRPNLEALRTTQGKKTIN